MKKADIGSQNNAKKTLTLLLIDVAIAGVLLVVFAYFHHVRPQAESEGVRLGSSFVQMDVEFSYNIVKHENSSRLNLIICAETQKDIGYTTIYADFDAAQLKYISTTAQDALFTKDIMATQTDGRVTVLMAKDESSPFIFRHDDSPDDSADNAIFVISFESVAAVDPESIDITVSVDSSGLLASDGSLATFSVNNGETVLSSSGDFRSKFPNKFTDGEIIETENSYASANVNVTLERHEETINEKRVVYFVSDIYVRSYDYFKTGLANGKFGRGYDDPISKMAKKNNAIVAVNGDYYGARSVGPVVRNGMLYRTDEFDDIFVMYTDGSMKAFEKGTYGSFNYNDGNIWQVWAFGPSLLTADGQVKDSFNSVVNRANPRTAIGYYEPGHYCIVVVDGRGGNGSDGITTQELSKLFYDMGCAAAFNLDGGQTTVGTWNGKVFNSPVKGGRECSDIVYIPKE